MQSITIKDPKSGAALIAVIEGSLIIQEAADTTAFQMGGFRERRIVADVYLPGHRFTIETSPLEA